MSSLVRAVFLGLSLLLVLSSASVTEAKEARVSSVTHPNVFLTHAPDYTPPLAPASPEELYSYAAHQLDLIESHSDEHDFPSPKTRSGTPRPFCSTCQLFIQVSEWALESNSTMGLVEVLLDDFCNKVKPNSTTCPKVINILLKLGEKLPGFMHHVGLYEPVRVCSFLSLCGVDCCSDDVTPTQIALGVGRNSSEMHVSWVTGGSSAPTTVSYGTDPSNLDQTVTGYGLTYTDGGWEGYIHRCVLTELEPNIVYFYQIGGSNGPVLNFTTWNDEDLTVPFSIGLTGDMAVNDNGWSPLNIAFINAATEAGLMQAFIHVGDISYADGYMKSWDDFFTTLQPTMTRIPYQVCPGNHELLFNFSAYKSRFFTSGLDANTQPGENGDEGEGNHLMNEGISGTNMWSSYDIGCTHFISLSSEDNFNTAWIGQNQLDWLADDLENFKARAEIGYAHGSNTGSCSVNNQTFLVVYLHRPLYCTDLDSDNCQGTENNYLQQQVEDLFMHYGVDMVFNGHMHNYERSVPVYQNQPTPDAPYYVTNGAGGNREGIENNWISPPVWGAIQSSSTGIGQLQIISADQLQWSFLQQMNRSTDPLANMQLIDTVTLTARDRSRAANERRDAFVKQAIELREEMQEKEEEAKDQLMEQSALDDEELEDDSAVGSELEFDSFVTIPNDEVELNDSPMTDVSKIPNKSMLISINDPNWFFSPYNWNFQPRNAQGSFLYTQSNNPGAYFKVSFTGTSFVLLLNTTNTPAQDYMNVQVSIDDGLYQNYTLPSALTSSDQLVLATNLNPNVTHTVTVFILNSIQSIDRWKAPLNVLRIRGAIVDFGASLSPYPFLFTKSMLVYWDSIGEGIAVAGRNGNGDLSDNDSTRNWVQVISQSLKAEVGSVSYGAQGYLQVGSFWPLMNPNDTQNAWSWYDSSSSRLNDGGLLVPQPDYIVMGHATNDFRWDPAVVQSAAYNWLHAIRTAAPLSPLLFTIPFGLYQKQALTNAYNQYMQGTTDPNMYLVSLESYNSEQGLSLFAGGEGQNRASVDGLHPLAWRAEQLGGFMAAEYERVMRGEPSKGSQCPPHTKRNYAKRILQEL